MARTHGHGNPNWTRDETILALDLYFDCKQHIPSRADRRVQDLSISLRQLPFHGTASRKESFRNPDSVSFKLQNIHNVATGKGLGNVSETDRRVWAEFGTRPEKVKQIAALIRAGATVARSLPEELDHDEFFEGRIVTELHKRKERDPAVRKSLIASRLKNGRLACDLCNTPGTDKRELEDAIFEAHHLLPMSLAIERKTRLADMALLCANCHRLLHRAIKIENRWLDLGKAREVLRLLVADRNS